MRLGWIGKVHVKRQLDCCVSRGALNPASDGQVSLAPYTQAFSLPQVSFTLVPTALVADSVRRLSDNMGKSDAPMSGWYAPHNTKPRHKTRHDRQVKNRLSRRALLKSGVALAASLMVPVPIRANVPAVVEPNTIAPAWTKLLEHVGGDQHPALRAWVRDLAVRPNKPQRPLLLTGADHGAKLVFHDAMRMLLPKGGVVRMPEDMNYQSVDLASEWLEPDPRLRAKRRAKIKATWLMVVNDPQIWYMRLHRRPRFRDGRLLKWSYPARRCRRRIVFGQCRPSCGLAFGHRGPSASRKALLPLARKQELFCRALRQPTDQIAVFLYAMEHLGSRRQIPS